MQLQFSGGGRLYLKFCFHCLYYQYRLTNFDVFTWGGDNLPNGSTHLSLDLNAVYVPKGRNIYRAGLPEQGAGETTIFDLAWGTNFDNGNGNAVLTISAEKDAGILHGERSWSRDNGIYSTVANPDPNGPTRTLLNDVGYWLTSHEGSIAPGFGGRSDTYVDINGNGVADCQESEGGRVGYLAGCWLTNPDGSVRVNQDGVLIDGLLGTGGCLLYTSPSPRD